jgi:hypothetical protein
VNKKRAAYLDVIITVAMLEDFMGRVYPALIRAGSAWYRLPTFEDDDKRAEIVALGWMRRPRTGGFLAGAE